MEANSGDGVANVRIRAWAKLSSNSVTCDDVHLTQEFESYSADCKHPSQSHHIHVYLLSVVRQAVLARGLILSTPEKWRLRTAVRTENMQSSRSHILWAAVKAIHLGLSTSVTTVTWV